MALLLACSNFMSEIKRARIILLRPILSHIDVRIILQQYQLTDLCDVVLL